MPAEITRVPQLANGIEIGPDSARDAKVMVAAPIGRYFDVAPATARLLRLVDGNRSIEEIAAQLSNGSESLTPAALSELLDRVMVPAGLIHFGTEPVPAAGPRSHMWWSMTVLPERVVNALSAPLSVLYRTPIALLLGAAAVVGHAIFYAAHAAGPVPSNWNELAGWGRPLDILFASLIAHELGHSAALKSRGERPGRIGVGMYGVMFVWFADVTRAWRLPARSRAVVDIGGMFIQIVIAAALIAAWLVNHDLGLARAVVLIDLSLIANLNPLLRWDGYWVLVDLTGQTNLRQRSLAHVRASADGRADGVPPLVGVYAWLSVAYFVGFAAWIVFRVLPRSTRLAIDAWRAVSAKPHADWMTVAFAGAAAAACLAFIAVLVIGVRTGVEMVRGRAGGR
jgi:putative peptide zinc metalloprotease protein